MSRSTIAGADARSNALAFMQDVLPFADKRIAIHPKATPYMYDVDQHVGSISWGRPGDPFTLYATPFFAGSKAIEWQWMDDEGRVIMSGRVDLNSDWLRHIHPMNVAADYIRIVKALLGMRNVFDWIV